MEQVGGLATPIEPKRVAETTSWFRPPIGSRWWPSHPQRALLIETKLSKESALLSCFPANGMKPKEAALHF
jgi:hypothetical protein